ncbi:MAG: hypothetical protein HKN03_16510 [Acidimicrobiales bacterium]|nr:hypothetical protein [Acidimicrobiales bacterium]
MSGGSRFGDDERIAQELRLQQREYLEEVENAVAETEAATTTLEARLLHLGNRSVEVTIEIGEMDLRGKIVHISPEFVTLRSPSNEEFGVVLNRVEAIRFGPALGAPAPVQRGYPQTLLARLRELWTAEERCTIGRVSSSAIVGTIQAVTEGHLELSDGRGANWLLPLETVAWIGPP